MEQVLYEIYLQRLHDQAWHTLITSYILTYICWIDYSARQLLKTRKAYVHCWIKLFKFTLIHRGSTSMRLQHQLNFKKYYTFCPWLKNNRCSSEWIVSLKGNSSQKTNKLQMKGLIVNSSDTKFDDRLNSSSLARYRARNMLKNANRRPPSSRFPWAHTFSGFLVVTSLECFFAECRGRSNVVVVEFHWNSLRFWIV